MRKLYNNIGEFLFKWIFKMFYKSFWQFVFQKPYDLRTVLCRWNFHRHWRTNKEYGVVFYRAWGTEPDMSCNNCGDDLG